MYKVAVIDDESTVREQLKELLKKYEEDNGVDLFSVSYFSDGTALNDLDVIENDIFLVDINMPEVNGLQLAKRIREVNPSAILIFCTNYAQYAVKGYELDASGYLIKPIREFSFYRNMNRVLHKLKDREEQKICINLSGKRIILPTKDILYLEVIRHNLYFHIRNQEGDSKIKLRGTMRDMSEKLEKMDFAKCSASYLLNLFWVDSAQKETVRCGGETFSVSRKYQKEFFERYMQYIEKHGVTNV